MYTPAHFAETDLARLHAAIEQFSFALLVSGPGDDLVASHLPLLIDRRADSQGTLLGHMARANGQWQSAAGTSVLAIFSGPHAYISPTWYVAEKTVPTWNYVAVHVYGKLDIIADPAETLALLRRTVALYESAYPMPWRLEDQPVDFIERLSEQIVAFRIPIERIEGKWKLNQNHPPERRQRVIAELEGQGGDDRLAIARLMREK